MHHTYILFPVDVKQSNINSAMPKISSSRTKSKCNPWIDFMKSHKDGGHSMKSLRSLYHTQKGNKMKHPETRRISGGGKVIKKWTQSFRDDIADTMLANGVCWTSAQIQEAQNFGSTISDDVSRTKYLADLSITPQELIEACVKLPVSDKLIESVITPVYFIMAALRVPYFSRNTVKDNRPRDRDPTLATNMELFDKSQNKLLKLYPDAVISLTLANNAVLKNRDAVNWITSIPSIKFKSTAAPLAISVSVEGVLMNRDMNNCELLADLYLQALTALQFNEDHAKQSNPVNSRMVLKDYFAVE
jgi:hypothetical protein